MTDILSLSVYLTRHDCPFDYHMTTITCHMTPMCRSDWWSNCWYCDCHCGVCDSPGGHGGPHPCCVGEETSGEEDRPPTVQTGVYETGEPRAGRMGFVTLMVENC